MRISRKATSRKNERTEGLIGMAAGAGIVFSGKLFGKFLLFLYTVFLATWLDPRSIGIYFLGTTIVGFIHVAANIGLKVGVTRYVSIYHGRGDWANIKSIIISAMVVAGISSVILTVASFVTAGWCSEVLFKKPQLSMTLKAFSFSIPSVTAMWIFLAATRGMKMMRQTALIEEVGLIASRFLIAVVFTFVIKDRLSGIIWAYVLSSWLCMLLSFFSMVKHMPKIDGPLPVRQNIGPLFRFSVPMVFSMMMGQLSRQIDIVMIGVLLTAKDVGVYSIVVRIVLLAEIITRVFAVIFNPYAAQLHAARQIGKLVRLLKLITKWNFAISYPVFLSMMFFPVVFLNLFGHEFAAGAGCLIVLSITHLIGSFSDLTDVVIFMSGRSDIAMKNNLGALILNIILNYFFIIHFGIVGAAFATGITLVGLSVIRILELHYLMKINPFDISAIPPIIVGGVLMACFVLSINMIKNVMNVAQEYVYYVGLVGFFLIYFVFIFTVNLSDEELDLKQIIKKKMFKGYKYQA